MSVLQLPSPQGGGPSQLVVFVVLSSECFLSTGELKRAIQTQVDEN